MLALVNSSSRFREWKRKGAETCGSWAKGLTCIESVEAVSSFFGVLAAAHSPINMEMRSLLHTWNSETNHRRVEEVCRRSVRRPLGGSCRSGMDVARPPLFLWYPRLPTGAHLLLRAKPDGSAWSRAAEWQAHQHDDRLASLDRGTMWDVQKIARAKSGTFSDQAPGGLAQRVEPLEVGSHAKRVVVASGTASRVIVNGSAVTFSLYNNSFFSPF